MGLPASAAVAVLNDVVLHWRTKDQSCMTKLYTYPSLLFRLRRHLQSRCLHISSRYQRKTAPHAVWLAWIDPNRFCLSPAITSVYVQCVQEHRLGTIAPCAVGLCKLRRSCTYDDSFGEVAFTRTSRFH